MRLFTVFAVANKPLDSSYLEREIKQADECIMYSLRKNSVYFGMAGIWGAALWLSS